MPLKVVWQYKQGGEGWSEVFQTNQGEPEQYIAFNGSDLAPTCPAALFMEARKKLFRDDVFVNHVRASKLGSPQVALSATIPDPVGQGLFPRPSTASGFPQGSAEIFAKLLIRISAGSTRRRTLWLGGIPETIISAPQTYVPTSAWLDRLAPFYAILTGGIYGFVGRPKPTDSPVAVPIQSFTVSAADARTVLCTPLVRPGSNPPNWYVIVRSVKQPRGWNGVHRAQVSVSDPTAMILGPTRKPGVSLPPWTNTTGGTFQLDESTFLKYDVCIGGRVVQKKVGPPFGTPRGRR